MMQQHDILIIGGGIVGLTLALKLARLTRLSIGIIESQSLLTIWSKDQYQHRVSAISLTSQKIFQSIDVWDDICAKRISPFTDILVWDAAYRGEIQFNSQDIAEAALGFIIENAVMQTSLLQKLADFPQISLMQNVALQSLVINERGVCCQLSNDDQHTAKIVIGADGGRSWLREHCHFEQQQTDYHQQAIVTTVTTELPHLQMARQVFLSTGPLAFLPLQSPQQCSIVWSLPTEKAQEYLALEESAFVSQLSDAFDRLGRVIKCEPRFSFPLVTQHSDKYILDRVALVGDAAHVIHPLAGQGLNLGLQDAECLANVIADAWQAKRNYGSYATLRRYERERGVQNRIMMAGVDGLKRLFADDSKPVQVVRSLGLDCLDQWGWVKNKFVRYASKG